MYFGTLSQISKIEVRGYYSPLKIIVKQKNKESTKSNKTMFYYSFHNKNPGPIHQSKVIGNINTIILIYAMDNHNTRKVSKFRDHFIYFWFSSRENCEIDIEYHLPEEKTFFYKKQSNDSSSSGDKPTLTKDDPYYKDMLKMFKIRKDKTYSTNNQNKISFMQ